MRDTPLSTKEIPLTGKLITSEDPTIIGTNYQSLKNMRYTEASIRGIGGHSKINSTVLTNPKVRSGIHFKKSNETHVLAEAYNSALTSSKIYENTTAIPNTGDFNATELYTPKTGTGRFSQAPNGYIAYANGAETCIYGGDESKIGGFINYAPDDSFSKDQTEQVSDTVSSGSGHIATLSRVTNSTSDDVLLLHLDNNDTDASTTTVHTVTDPNVTYTATGAKFGTHQASLSTNASFVVPTHADFDFSGTGATWSIDYWGLVNNLTNPHPIYHKQTDASNYFSIFINTSGEIVVSHFASGSETLNSTAGFKSSVAITASTQYHIEIDRNGSNWYIFVDGQLKGYLSDSTDIGTETGNVLIGTDGTEYYDGTIDEYRVSSIATHTGDFAVPDSAYGDGFATYLYAGFILPVSGIKFYVSTANSTAATSTVEYWDGSDFAPVSTFVDGTLSSGKSFGQSGSMTFDSTDSVASLKDVKGVFLYWYRIKIDGADDNISVYSVTGKTPFQPMKDIWDGLSHSPLSFLKDTGTYEDYTTAVYADDYIDGEDSTYIDLSGLTSSQSLIVGFEYRQLGVRFSLIGDYVNTTANTIASVDYWNGTTWASVGAISDKTSKNNVSFGQAGLITWGKIADGLEFKTEFTGAIEVTPILYYYRITFTSTVNGGRLNQVSGVPAQTVIGNYSFPLSAMNRLWLFSDQDGEKNKSICSSKYTTNTFNGDDSIPLFWGDEEEITGGAWLYSQYGASVYSVLVVFKKNETWVLIGNDPETWQQYKISSSIGCVSPNTIKVLEMPTDASNGVNRSSIIVFQGANGIYMTDGRPPILISQDLDIFDKRKSLITNIDESFAFIDIENQEYHWCFAESAYCDTEYVLDYSKMRWFEIDRPLPLQYGIEVHTTEGATYTYGFIEGYMVRLEHGNSFDGSSITQEFQFGDIALNENHVTLETSAEFHNLILKSKTTTNEITITHYGDSSTTGTALTLSPIKSGYRTVRSAKHKSLGSHLFHSWKLSLSTDDETTGFEPLFFSCLYKQTRQYTKDYR